MKKIILLIPFLLMTIYCRAINEVEPNDEFTDSGVITLTTNEVFSGELPNSNDEDLWNIEAGSSGEVTITTNNDRVLFLIYYGLDGYVDIIDRGPVLRGISSGSLTFDLDPSYYYTILIITTFPSATYSGTIASGALPVEMVSFDASLTSKNQMNLNWQTASELNNRYFQVEHSTDARAFTPIGIVEGNGTTNELQSYSYIHNLPKFGHNYYRLKQVDYDGVFAYSNIVNINYRGKTGSPPLIIYPNPVFDELSLSNLSLDDLELEVFNHLGQFQFKSNLAEGQTREMQLGELVDGTYFIRIKTESEYLYEKFIKVSP